MLETCHGVGGEIRSKRHEIYVAVKYKCTRELLCCNIHNNWFRLTDFTLPKMVYYHFRRLQKTNKTRTWQLLLHQALRKHHQCVQHYFIVNTVLLPLLAIAGDDGYVPLNNIYSFPSKIKSLYSSLNSVIYLGKIRVHIKLSFIFSIHWHSEEIFDFFDVFSGWPTPSIKCTRCTCLSD